MSPSPVYLDLKYQKDELTEAVRHIEGKMAKNVKKEQSCDSSASESESFTSQKDVKTKATDKTQDAKKAKGINWRVDDKYFLESSASRMFQKGVENFSSGWFAQGHEVCKLLLHEPSHILILL